MRRTTGSLRPKVRDPSAMSDTDWTPLPLVAGNGAKLLLVDPSVGSSPRFYRVQRW
jgi:hypothetical protein